MRALRDLLRPVVSASGRRARQGLEIGTMLRRLDELERRVEAVDHHVVAVDHRVEAVDRHVEATDHHVERARWPHGPVYAGNGTAIVATRWGAKLYVDCSDSVLAPWLLLDGLWETGVTTWFHQVVFPGAHVVDVGANIGYFTVLGAKLTGPTGRVVGFEANPRLRPIAARNLAANSLHGHAEVRHLAAWSEATELVLHLRRHFTGNSSFAPFDPAFLHHLGDEASEQVRVPAAALDDELADLGRVDVVKIDVEGAELRVMQGLRRTLAANSGIRVLCEWSPDSVGAVGDDAADLVALFDDLGLVATVLQDDGTVAPPPADGLLALPYGNLVLARP